MSFQGNARQQREGYEEARLKARHEIRAAVVRLV